jgi:hypothetical protein
MRPVETVSLIPLTLEQNADDSSITHLALRTHRNTHFSSCAEVVGRNSSIYLASIRVNARVWATPAPRPGSSRITRLAGVGHRNTNVRPDMMRYTNQPNTDAYGYTIPQAGIEAAMPNGSLWTDWNVHRVDWLANVSRWFVNGIEATNNTYGVPQHQSFFTMNIWSDGADWSGNMSLGGAAYLEVQWVEMVFNISGAQPGNVKRHLDKRDSTGACQAVCAVDGVPNVGVPEALSSRVATSYQVGCAELFLVVLGSCFALILL